MRKTVLLCAALLAAMLLASGVAWALTTITCTASKSCQGTGGDDEIYGTDLRDVIIPYDGNDVVYANGGNDEVRHSFGDDTIYGGPGNDTLRGGRGTDRIYGGPGKDLIDCAYLETRANDVGDTAYADSEDTVVDCKDVYDDPTTPWK